MDDIGFAVTVIDSDVAECAPVNWIVGEDPFSFGVSPRSEHFGVVKVSIAAVGWALASVGEWVRKRVVEGDVTPADDDEIGLLSPWSLSGLGPDSQRRD